MFRANSALWVILPIIWISIVFSISALSKMKSTVFLRAITNTAEFIFERFAKMSDKCEELKSEINNRETN